MQIVAVPSAEFVSAIEAIRNELALSANSLDRMDKQNKLVGEILNILSQKDCVTRAEFRDLSLKIYHGVGAQPLPKGQ